MRWRLRYPGGRQKALTLSYDDGQVHDRRLVEALNRHGIRATFHLNTATLDTDGFVTRREVPKLYTGHEIACHGAEHADLTLLGREQLANEIWENRRDLEALAGYPVRGMSYAYGNDSPAAVETLKALGIAYARTVAATGRFGAPMDFYQWNPTCHHNDDLPERAERFLHLEGGHRLPLLYVWGHSYEFDRQDNWDTMEAFCRKMGNREEIWYATNLEYCDYRRAAASLITTADGSVCTNLSGVELWGEVEGHICSIPPGDTVRV